MFNVKANLQFFLRTDEFYAMYCYIEHSYSLLLLFGILVGSKVCRNWNEFIFCILSEYLLVKIVKLF